MPLKAESFTLRNGATAGSVASSTRGVLSKCRDPAELASSTRLKKRGEVFHDTAPHD
jgi:hypothetical protein